MPRRSADSRVNLASNELIHPDVTALHRRMLEGLSWDELRTYPVLDRPVQAVATLFGCDETEVSLAPGSDSGIRLLLRVTASRFKGRLLIQAPNYTAWWTAQEAQGWTIREVFSPDRTAEGSLAALDAEIVTAKPSLVVMSWPNGPAGFTPDLSAVRAFATRCAMHGHLLVIDACYAGFTADPRTVAQLAGDACVVLLSWSKLFGLAGGRVAALFSSPRLIDEVRALEAERQLSAPTLHAVARTGLVYREFARIWRALAAERERWNASLLELGWRTLPSGGNFIPMIAPDPDVADRAEALASASGYRIRNLSMVRGCGPLLRVSVACGPIADRALHALHQALRGAIAYHGGPNSPGHRPAAGASHNAGLIDGRTS
ncbi:hypothetical protein GCM10010116_23240 [Microbispora rosea subsp. aerata]|nr:hypothetical protein GCM10010116_23240 [Microbispora rosea subsp. aerata]